MKSVLEYLENIKNDNKVIDKFGSRTYKEILKNAKVIGSKLGSFVKNKDNFRSELFGRQYIWKKV